MVRGVRYGCTEREIYIWVFLFFFFTLAIDWMGREEERGVVLFRGHSPRPFPRRG